MKLGKYSKTSLSVAHTEDQNTPIPASDFDLGPLRQAFTRLLTRLEDAASALAILAFRIVLHLFLLWRVEVRNEDALKRCIGKPSLLVANHSSHLDFIVLNALFKQRYGARITFLAKKELGESWLWRMLIRYGNSIPVDRAQFGIGTLRAMKNELNSGGFMGMFPEGTRSADGRLLPIKPGLEFLVRLHPELLVVPCGLLGFQEAWPKGGLLRLLLPLRHRLVVSVGNPQCCSTQEGSAEFARRMMTEVASLIDQPAPVFEAAEERKRVRKNAA